MSLVPAATINNAFSTTRPASCRPAVLRILRNACLKYLNCASRLSTLDSRAVKSSRPVPADAKLAPVSKSWSVRAGSKYAGRSSLMPSCETKKSVAKLAVGKPAGGNLSGEVDAIRGVVGAEMVLRRLLLPESKMESPNANMAVMLADAVVGWVEIGGL
ncbi:hypothetical protein Salat_1096000 [Sesamum alatum]|uniref:Uncharacterized protein n=1 Tax=Sesamum alatum TaxID=300844 RepID=A0AAE2CSX6_9LAMI|nr:hypothetical protein Salat_1096000 [Sesamum alatum]